MKPGQPFYQVKKIFYTAVVLTFCQATCKTASPCIGTPVPDCICTQQYQPVCGCDNKTYGNACTARCAGIKSWKEGECR